MGEYDVVVVGGGLAGLVAANKLAMQNKKVVILEASDEAGGRIKTRSMGNQHMELGAAYIGKRHFKMKNLVKELGLSLKKSSHLFVPFWWNGKGSRRFLPDLSISNVFTTIRIFRSLDHLAKEVDPIQPWESSNAREFDGLSFHEWLTRQTDSPKVYHFISTLISGFATCPIDKISFLHVLWWISRSGGVWKSFQDGSYRIIEEGAQQVPFRLQEQLHNHIVFKAPVSEVHQQKRGVKIIHSQSEVLFARYVILTVPIPAVKTIAFTPELPENLQNIYKELDAANGFKIGALINRRKGFDQIAIGHNLLPLAWKTGKTLGGIGFQSQPDITAKNRLSHILKTASIVWAELYWWKENPYIRGSYTIFSPGQLTRFGPLLKHAHGSVYFAGAERGSWVNSMEGAVESGEEVAERVIRLLTL